VAFAEESCGDFADSQISAHFFETFFADAANRQQIVHAFEGAVRFAHL